MLGPASAGMLCYLPAQNTLYNNGGLLYVVQTLYCERTQGSDRQIGHPRCRLGVIRSSLLPGCPLEGQKLAPPRVR